MTLLSERFPPNQRPVHARRSRRSNMALICLAQLLVMSLWFSATAVVPGLVQEFHLSSFQVALFTSTTQIGFVVGTLISVGYGFADRWDSRLLFSVSSGIGAVATALILACNPTSATVPALRFITGMALAGVYPVGLKMAAGWARGDAALLLSLLVGALTVGSASPHLLNAIGGLGWRAVLMISAGSAALGSIVGQWIELGPGATLSANFKLKFISEAWTNRSVRFANLGYFGHMWELYAMWAWIGIFLQSSFSLSHGGSFANVFERLGTFAVIGSGAAGCIVAGFAAERWGRTKVAMAAMMGSGSMAITAGLLYGKNSTLLLVVCIVWGITVIADSAQFSATVAATAKPETLGTMLTLQTCIGFAITFVAIQSMPFFVSHIGWRGAFTVLAAGPLLGLIPMSRLLPGVKSKI